MKRALAPIGLVAVLAAVVTLAIAGCGGGKAKPPPPAAASPAPGSAVVYAVGTSYAAPIYQETGSLLSPHGITLNYQLTGGTRGPFVPLHQRSVDLVAAESARPMLEFGYARGSSEMYVPVAFGAVDVIYNLPGVHSLRLRGGVLAAIYAGRIQHWNDRRIRRDNPGEPLPSSPITVVHRSDAASVSDLLTEYLSSSLGAWRRKVGTGATVSWPAGTAVSSDAGMLQLVSQNPGAIGYTDQATALQDKLHTVMLRNPSGEFVSPRLPAISAVGSGARSVSVATIGSHEPGAYPIAAEAFMLSFRDPCDAGLSTSTAKAVQRVLGYLVGPGQRVVRQFSFAPLPGPMRRAAAREVRRMRCGGIDF
jgi:phosphate transport system substrate-binding protein